MKLLLSSLSRKAGLFLEPNFLCFSMSRSRRWRTTNIGIRQQARAAANNKMDSQTNYEGWTQESLIERVTELEKELKAKNLRSAEPILFCEIDSDMFLATSIAISCQRKLELSANSILQSILPGLWHSKLPTWGRTTMASNLT
jgi:hypothetical protein